MNDLSEGYFNTGSALFFLVIYVATPPAFIVLSYLSYEKIRDPSNQSFFGSYGSLYDEFKKDKGFFSTQYYFIYFLRRLAYVGSQAYLNKLPFVQNSFNLFFSVIQSFYLVYYKPFKEKHILISNYVGEICVLIVFSDAFLFLMDVEQKTITVAENVFIYSVLGCMAIQLFISLYCLYLALKKLIAKLTTNKSIRNINESNIAIAEKK